MDLTFQRQIIDELKARFRFRKVTDAWLREGQCPDCQRWELFAAAKEPKVITCGRTNNCGYQESVRAVCADLFEDWSERFKPSAEEPNASADAYLRSRGLDLTGLRDSFTQETYRDPDSGAVTATVRFPLPGGSWWERLIDRPGRFSKKARFKYGSNPGGHCWAHPDDSWAELAKMDEIWLAEGIFNALALRQNFKRLEKAGSKRRCTAVSTMSSGFYPEHFLDELRKAIAGDKKQPELVFAFDVGPAGVKASRKFVARAIAEHWTAGAAIPTVDGEGADRDWNDLWLRQMDHTGDDRREPLSSDALEEFRWNGSVTLAESAVRKARLIYNKHHWSSFDFRFDNRIFWARSKKPDDDGSVDLDVEEVANCSFRILYRERDEPNDETDYFMEVRFPNNLPTAKARFSASTCMASGDFMKRLFAFGGIWSGNQEQLVRLMRAQTRNVKTVTPFEATGYHAGSDAWILGDLAVRHGRVHPIGPERYFDFGKTAVKLKDDSRLLSIDWNPDDLDFSWVRDIWTAWGERGLATLAFFTLSLFANHIRDHWQSLGFLEIWGEPGSGKTTLVEFCWKLLGRQKYEGFDPNKDTKVSTARQFMQVSGLPVGLIESGRSDEKERHQARFDWAELLTLFNGRSPRGIGVKTSRTATYAPPFLGSIYMMQNNRIDAVPAVLERIMSMEVGKSLWSADSKPAARRLERWDPRAASRWIVHVTRAADKYLDFYNARVEHHDLGMPARVQAATGDDLSNGRIVLCHSQLAAGVEALRHLIPGQMLPDHWIERTVAFIDRMAAERQNVAAAEHPVVERFWGIFDYLCALETDDPDNPINLHRGTDLIAVNMPRFMEACRARGQNPPTDEELRRHLRSSKQRKFIGTKSVNARIGKSLHCWVFQRGQHERRPERIV